MKKFFKRILDISISLPAVLLLLPVFAIVIIAIRVSSKGAAIFKQERAGRNDKPFVLYKFRTMKLDTDPFGQSPKSDNDPRLIKIGKFLREYSVDELPQLFNILKGDMSIVGPRPLYVSQISELSDYHKKRLLVRPGLTGLSQIYGRSSLLGKSTLDLEVEYVEKRNFWLDIKIILLTFGALLRKKGVYEE